MCAACVFIGACVGVDQGRTQDFWRGGGGGGARGGGAEICQRS